jgi:hypothetical protein
LYFYSLQVLTALRYLAKGDFYSEVSDLHGISPSSTSRIIWRVIDALPSLHNINFPLEGDHIIKTKQSFFKIAGLPNVLGAVDGTLIPIYNSTETMYVCRKGFPAINVMAVADANMR